MVFIKQWGLGSPAGIFFFIPATLKSLEKRLNKPTVTVLILKRNWHEINDYIRRQNDNNSEFRNMFCFSMLTLFLYLSSSFVCTNLINQPIERSADSDSDCIFTHEINVTASRDHPVMSSDADNHHLKRGNKNFDCYESRIVMKPNSNETSFLFHDGIPLTESWFKNSLHISHIKELNNGYHSCNGS